MSTASNIGIQLTLKGAEPVKQGLKTISGSAAEMARQFEASRGAILTTAAAVATATGIMVDRVSTAAAEIERFAMLAGSTPQEFQRMAAGAKSAGMDMEQYASTMKDVQDKIGDFLQTGGGELKDFFEKIAPAVGVTAEQFKNLSGPQALQLFYNSLEKANLSQKETVYWMESIADDATTLVPLLQNNGAAFDALGNRAEKYGQILADYALAAAKDFKSQTDEMTLALQGVEQILAVGLMPTLTETARELLATADSAGTAQLVADGLNGVLVVLSITANGVAGAFRAAGLTIAAAAAQAEAFTRLDFRGAMSIGQGWKDDLAKLGGDMDAFQKRLLNAGQTAKDVFNLSGVMKGNKTGTAEYQAALNALIRMKDDGTVSASQFTAAIKGATAANVSAAAAAGRTGKSLSGMGVGADAAKKAADTAKSAADKVASAYGTAWGNAAKLLRDVTAEEQNLNNAEKALADVMAGEHWAKFTAAQQAAAKAIYDRASAAIEARKIEEADAKWASESADANANVAESAYEAANAAEAQRDAQLQANAAIGLTALEVANLEAARIDDTAAEKQRLAAIMDGIDPAIAADYRRQAQALTELAEAKRDGAVKDAMAETAKEAADEWQRTADKIEDALIDALMDGGKSGAEYIEDLFRTMVLRPVLQAIVSPVAGAVTSALGFSGSAQAGQSGGGLGGLSSLNTAYSAITTGIRSSIASNFEKLVSNGVGEKLGLSHSYGDGNDYILSNVGEQFSGVAQGLGSTMTAYGLQKSLSGGYQTGEPGLADAATAIGGFFDPTGGLIAGSIGGTFNRAFGRKLKDQGLEGTFGGADGFDGNSYEFYKGGWFRSDKTKRKALDSGVEDALETQFKALQTQTALMAQTLGLGVDSVADFTTKIKVSFKGLSEEQISQRMAEEFGKVAESMASVALGTTEYTRTGETAVETLTRLSSSLTTVNGTFDVLGQKLLDTSLAGADMASQLVDLMGGLESFIATTASYYQNFYTEAERADTATRQLTEALAEIGINAMPATRDAYRDLVESQDLTTESGRETYAALLGLSGAFAALVPVATELSTLLGGLGAAMVDETITAIDKQIEASTRAGDAARDAAEKYRDAAKSLSDVALEIRYGAADNGTSQAYADTLAKAQGGDLTAMQGLGQSATVMLEQQRGRTSSAAEYAILAAQTANQLQQVSAVADVSASGADYQAMLYDVNTAALEVLKDSLQTGNVTQDLLQKQRDAIEDLGTLISDSAQLTIKAYVDESGLTRTGIFDAGGLMVSSVDTATADQLLALATQTTTLAGSNTTLGGTFTNALSGQTTTINSVGQSQVSALGLVQTEQQKTISATDVVAQVTGENVSLSDAILAQLKTPDASAEYLAKTIGLGNDYIAGRLDGIIAAINQQTAEQQAELKRQQDLQKAQAEAQAAAQAAQAAKAYADALSLAKGISSTFSGRESYRYQTGGSNFEDGVSVAGVYGNIGMNDGGSYNITASTFSKTFQDIAKLDAAIAATLSPEQNAKIKATLNGYVSGQNESTADYVANRLGAIKRTVGTEASPLVEKLIQDLGGVPAFHTGGYTGPGGKYEAAGVVHRGEVVFSQDDIARLGGVRAVEAIRTGEMPGYAQGGTVGAPVVVPAPAIPGRVAMAPRPATPDPVQQEREAQARDQAQRDAQQQTQDLIAQLRQVNSSLTELKRSVDKSGQANDQMNNKLYNTADTTLKLLRKFDALGLPVVQAATEAV